MHRVDAALKLRSVAENAHVEAEHFTALDDALLFEHVRNVCPCRFSWYADSDLAGKRRPVDSIEIESARENQEREESAAKCCHLLLREMPDPVNGTFLFR